MGLDYYLHLFNRRTYRQKILPAYRAFIEKEDTSSLTLLLKEIISTLEVNEKLPGPSLWSKEIYEGAIGILNGTVCYNPKGSYTNSQSKKTTLENKQFYVRESLIHDLLMALCVPRNKGVNPEQNMGRSSLIPYLYEKSVWIEELFTGIRKVRGGQLELTDGETAKELFTKQDLKEFSSELAKIPPPDGEMEARKQFDKYDADLRESLKQQYPEDSAAFNQLYEIMIALQKHCLPESGTYLNQEYENLCKLLQLALEEPDLTLTLSVM
jgi:hypothetical protein